MCASASFKSSVTRNSWRSDALIVPEAAVTYDAQKNAFVEVADPGTKSGRKKVAVKLGVGNGTKIQILDGLKQGDKVILPS